jgi:hypothetical protein
MNNWGFHFEPGAPGVAKKKCEFTIRKSPFALGDIARHRDRGAP